MKLRSSAWLVAAALAIPALAHAQAENDDLKCYKITDPLTLAAVANLDSSQFGLDAGCKVSKAQYFCVPASKTLVSAENKKTKQPITPLPVSGPDAGDRICYKVKCPRPAIPEQSVTDTFGTRTVKKLKTSFLCTPAVKGQGYCGNGTIDPGERCDGAAIGTCGAFYGCRSDCQCELGANNSLLSCGCDNDGLIVDNFGAGGCLDTNNCNPATVTTLCQQICNGLGYPSLSASCVPSSSQCLIGS